MKKIFTLALAAVGCALVSTGCMSTETNRTGDQIAVNMSINVKPQVDIKSQKVSGQAKVHSVLGLINWGVDSQAVGVNFGSSAAANFLSLVPSGENVAKNGAVYDACIKNKADILVAPQYILKRKDYIVYKVIECKVTGFPGTVKSVKLVK